MTGPSIDPATLSTMSAKLDYALALLDTMNKQLDSNEVRIARLEKFQQEKKARAAAAPAAAMVTINRHIDTSAARPSSTMDFVVQDPMLQQGSVAVDGIDHHDLVDPTAADEILEHALHMEEPIQIVNCNQLRSFGEAPAAVYFAASDRIDSAVVAALLSPTALPAGADLAGVQPEDVAASTIQIGVPSGPCLESSLAGPWLLLGLPRAPIGGRRLQCCPPMPRLQAPPWSPSSIRAAAPLRNSDHQVPSPTAIRRLSPTLDAPLAHGIISAAATGCADLALQFCGFAFRRASFRPGRDRPVGLVGYLLLGASAHKEPTAGLFCYALLLCGLQSCCCFSWAGALVQTRIPLFTWDLGGIRTAGSAFQVIHVEGGKYPGIMAEEIKIICYFF